MAKSSETKDQAEADKRRDALAKRVLKMPPAPKPAPKSGTKKKPAN